MAEDAGTPQWLIEARGAATTEAAPDVFDQVLSVMALALKKLGIDTQKVILERQGNDDFIVSILSAKQQEVPYARIERRTGKVTLLKSQIKPREAP
jgi:hypothetical protein